MLFDKIGPVAKIIGGNVSRQANLAVQLSFHEKKSDNSCRQNTGCVYPSGPFAAADPQIDDQKRGYDQRRGQSVPQQAVPDHIGIGPLQGALEVKDQLVHRQLGPVVQEVPHTPIKNNCQGCDKDEEDLADNSYSVFPRAVTGVTAVISLCIIAHLTFMPLSYSFSYDVLLTILAQLPKARDIDLRGGASSGVSGPFGGDRTSGVGCLSGPK